MRVTARSRAGLAGAPALVASTATLAALPGSAASTFTAVEAGSVTVQWAANGNRAGTQFLVQTATSSDFGGTVLGSGFLTGVSTTVFGLAPNATFYARVSARNQDGRATPWASLGSTVTVAETGRGPPQMRKRRWMMLPSSRGFTSRGKPTSRRRSLPNACNYRKRS